MSTCHCGRPTREPSGGGAPGREDWCQDCNDYRCDLPGYECEEQFRQVIHLEIPMAASDEETENFFDAIADVAMDWKFAAPVDVNMWAHGRNCEESDHCGKREGK